MKVMQTYLNNWMLFSICFGLLLLVSFIMSLLGERFYTFDVIRKKFNMIELEVPASPKEMANLIKGIFLLPPEESARSLKAVRAQLGWDFLFMPCAYGSIFLVCWRIAQKMHHVGHFFSWY